MMVAACIVYRVGAWYRQKKLDALFDVLAGQWGLTRKSGESTTRLVLRIEERIRSVCRHNAP
jgi:hypothetical protein